MNLTTPIGRLRTLAIFEGISYLLFGITMPLKYALDIREPNLVVGMIHGVLFILYVLISLQNIYLEKWDWKKSFLILGASLLPVATFWVDHKYLKRTSNDR